MCCNKWLASYVACITIVCGGSRKLQAAPHPASQPGPYISKSLFTSQFASKDFVPDGRLNKPVWRGANWVKVERGAFDPVTHPQSAMDVASRWTQKYVYFAFRCKYTTLNLYEAKDPSKDFWKLWDRDVVEIFLNPQPERLNHYYEFQVAPNNLWIDLEVDFSQKPALDDPQWNSGFEHATQIDEQNHTWTGELRIPVRAFGVTQLAANTEWRVNFYRADGLGDDNQRRFLAWSPVRPAHTFHTPVAFGLIRFAK